MALDNSGNVLVVGVGSHVVGVSITQGSGTWTQLRESLEGIDGSTT